MSRRQRAFKRVCTHAAHFMSDLRPPQAEDALRVFAVACAEYPEDPQPVFALAGVHLKQVSIAVCRHSL